MSYRIFTAHCLSALNTLSQSIDITFLDPPFNQQAELKNAETDYTIANKKQSPPALFEQWKN
ncbi:MAG: hypothetical protein LBH00_07495 [Planctomycetaceae bacterium]|jgi:16S rRNA G966 N2-methylase RsmD|nr:hypothetical protein [Planctomycetaceae bacterium]